MPELSADSLFRACPELSGTRPLCIALSGGCDSLLLLHLVLDGLRQRQQAERLRVVHVDHGLQAGSASWARFCRQACSALGVPIKVYRLQGAALRDDAGGSLENSARRARYGCFTKHLKTDEVLLQAHHADDQMETLLFRLIRGSGPAGLSGIPRERPLGKGMLLRPLLDYPRADIVAAAKKRGLDWIEDPSNACLDHDRNYLRHQVIPVLTARWPGARSGFLRAARLQAEAQSCCDALATADQVSVLNHSGSRLRVEPLLALTAGRRRNLLRFHLNAFCLGNGLPAPDHISLERIGGELLTAAPSANPQVRWPKGQPLVEVRRYGGELYPMRALGPRPEPILWDGMGTIELGEGMGHLKLKPCKQGGFRWGGASLLIDFGRKGITVREPGRPGRSLGRFCQERRVPVWLRSRLPLLFEGERLLSVADLAIPAERLDESGGKRWKLVWLREDSR